LIATVRVLSDIKTAPTAVFDSRLRSALHRNVSSATNIDSEYRDSAWVSVVAAVFVGSSVPRRAVLVNSLAHIATRTAARLSRCKSSRRHK